MFMGPFEQMIPWDTKGCWLRRFVEKIWNLVNNKDLFASGKVQRWNHFIVI